jgi:hypothetical protein
MRQPPSLEPLEDRTLPSFFAGATLTAFLRFEATPGGAPVPPAQELAVFRDRGWREPGADSQGQTLTAAWQVIEHHPGLVMSLGSILQALVGSDDLGSRVKVHGAEREVAVGFLASGGDLHREEQAGATPGDRTPGLPVIAGVLPLPPGTARGDGLGSPDGPSPADGTKEMARAAQLGDTVLLDGWTEGVPPPQADLVPVLDRELAAVAAYLVGSPAPRGPADAGTASTPEAGLTDFVVGRQDVPPDPLTEPVDRAHAAQSEVPEDRRQADQPARPADETEEAPLVPTEKRQAVLDQKGADSGEPGASATGTVSVPDGAAEDGSE